MMMMIDADKESLLMSNDYSSSSSKTRNFGAVGNNNNNQQFYQLPVIMSSIRFIKRRNTLLLIIIFSIAFCLTVYLYLNIKAEGDSNGGGNDNDEDGEFNSEARYKPISRRRPMLDHESIFSDSGPSMIKLSDLLAHCIVALRIAGREVVNFNLYKGNKDQIGSKGRTLEGVDDVVTGADIKSHHIILNTIKDSYRRLKVVSEEDTTKEFENLSADTDLLPIDRVDFAKLIRADLEEIEAEHIDRGSLINQQKSLVWIDPLDATKEYSENLTSYVTLMACIVHDSIPIAGVIFKPFTNETYWSMWDPNNREESHYSPNLRSILKERELRSNSRQDQNLRVIVSRSHAGNIEDVLTKQSSYSNNHNNFDIISAGGSGYKTIELVSGNVDAYIHMTHIKKWDICAPNAIINSIPNGQLTTLNGLQITYGSQKEKLVEGGLIASFDKKIHQDFVNLMTTNREAATSSRHSGMR